MSPQSPSGAEVVAVTRADREAAAQVVYPLNSGAVSTDVADLAHNIRRGRGDDGSLVQAFARHRLAEQERCAKVADRRAEKPEAVPFLEPAAYGAHVASQQIATTIRSTTHDE